MSLQRLAFYPLKTAFLLNQPTFFPLRYCENDLSFLSEHELVDLLMFRSSTFSFEENANSLKASIKYIFDSERFPASRL